MEQKSQPVSPVIAPRASTLEKLGGPLRTAVRRRLTRQVADPNRLPNLLAAGPAGKPRVVNTNEAAVAVRDYAPSPGRQTARQLRLQIQNQPAPRVDQVIDAIQRYLNIRPRREPTADPLDEASVARHPQQIIQSASRWDAARYVQFTTNGGERYQFRPEFNTWSGRLNLTLEQPGPAALAAPAVRSPLSGRSPLGQYVTHDPAFAAQQAMGQMLERSAPEEPELKVGPPIMTENPYFEPAFAGENAMGRLRELLADTQENYFHAGPVNMIDNSYFDPAFAGENALARTRELLNRPQAQRVEVGPGDILKKPYFDPAFAGENAMARTRELLDFSPAPRVTVGPGSVLDSPYNQPSKAWLRATAVGVGLAAQSHNSGLASSFQPGVQDEAYKRAMRIINTLDRPWSWSPVLDGRT